MKLKVGILVSPCPSVRLRIILHVILRIMAGMRRIGNAEILSALSPRYGWNADIMRRFLRIPVQILPSAFSPHFLRIFFHIRMRRFLRVPVRILPSAFSPQGKCRMQRSGVRGLKKSTLVPVRAWCQKDGNPLPQPKFTKIPDVIWHHLATISLLISPLVPHYRGGRSWRELIHWGLVAEIWVTIGSGNGLLPDGTKPLPEPMLTYQ